MDQDKINTAKRRAALLFSQDPTPESAARVTPAFTRETLYYVHVTPRGRVRYNRPCTETRFAEALPDRNGQYTIREHLRFDFHDVVKGSRAQREAIFCKTHTGGLSYPEAIEYMRVLMRGWKNSRFSEKPSV